jgi:hypothetical protein
MSITFRMTGRVCGSCSHQHVSVVGAAQCAWRFERVCDEAGNYSDRRLWAMEDGAVRAATGNELHEFTFAYDVEKTRRASKKPKEFQARF